jgi:Zn-dependent protease
MLFDIFQISPAIWLARIFVLVIAFSVHEFAHAWAADRFGDNTPRMNGRLTLNPLAHLDPIGSLMLLFAGFGWAKPVPVNPYALGRSSPSALMWVALAGPMSNFLMAVLAAVPLKLGLLTLGGFGPFNASFAIEFVYQFIFINLALMLFNLLPIAPLDGEKIADHFFPPSWTRVLDTIRPYGPIILVLLMVSGLTWLLISPPLYLLFNILVS